ncbi:unnamed protein product [Phytomonas sp. EM1]|nr:unnamed protein product [Phytomonas sp. EM1]|eukprot:CCW61208.1 unnamed protein product [Phytomonas sp. isolate EM1]
MKTSSLAVMGAGSHNPGDPFHVKGHVFSDYHFSSYVAADTLITVVPRFSMRRVTCISGHYGPFSPNYPVEIPLWLALHLRQTDTCVITLPSYLSLSHLSDVVAREQRNDNTFEPLPFFFFEVAKNLCELAHEDVPNVAEVIRLVRELQSMRQRKLQQSMSIFEAEGTAMFIPGIRLTHIVSAELHYLRTSFAVVLRQACEMEQKRSQALRMIPVSALQPATTLMRSTATSTGADGLSERLEGDIRISLTSASPTIDLTPAVVGGDTDGPALEFPDSHSVTTLATSSTTVHEVPLGQPPVKKRRTLRQT